MGDGLKLVLQRVERAKEQRRDLEREMRTFQDDQAYVVGSQLDAETGYTLFYLHSFKLVPPIVGHVLGETLHSWRTVLDHLAYQLYLIDRANCTIPEDRIEFPFYDPAKRSESEAFRPIKCFREVVKEAIRAVKAHQGGNDLLWALHRLDNINKHRRLITCVLNPHSIYFGDAIREMMIGKGYGDMVPFFNLDVFRPCLRAGEKAEVGHVLFRGSPGDEKINEKLQFTFDVALDEPEIIKSKSMIETVDGMGNVVENIVADFAPFLL